jgi:hypothetical protein
MMQVYRAGGVLASIGPGHMERRWLEWIESMEVDWKAIPHHNPDDSRPWMSRVWSAIQVVMKSRGEWMSGSKSIVGIDKPQRNQGLIQPPLTSAGSPVSAIDLSCESELTMNRQSRP